MKWARKYTATLLSALTFLVFLCLDFLDVLLCLVYKYLDVYFEGKSACYCERKESLMGNVGGGEESPELSESLYGRKNVFRQMGFFGFAGKLEEDCFRASRGGVGRMRVNKWSDCGCENCISWMKTDGEIKLHVEIREPLGSGDAGGDCCWNSTENVIFLHGFLASSSYWTQTVFPNVSEPITRNYRLFAVDLLGFGKSPKPSDCLYTLEDHLEMIEKSVVNPYKLRSFHLVAHSMGCIIALALAAKYPQCIKSITLVAPPCIPSSKEEGSLVVLQKVAGKRLWPPLLFGSAFMSWYEHLGRCICFLVCRNHRMWERILKLLTCKRDLHFLMIDLTKHTHHSAWHTMHNVICGGSKLMDGFFEILVNSGVRIYVIQGDHDIIVPLDCIDYVKQKVPKAEICIIENAEHDSVIIGREKEFTRQLEHVLVSFSDKGI